LSLHRPGRWKPPFSSPSSSTTKEQQQHRPREAEAKADADEAALGPATRAAETSFLTPKPMSLLAPSFSQTAPRPLLSLILSSPEPSSRRKEACLLSWPCNCSVVREMVWGVTVAGYCMMELAGQGCAANPLRNNKRTASHIFLPSIPPHGPVILGRRPLLCGAGCNRHCSQRLVKSILALNFRLAGGVSFAKACFNVLKMLILRRGTFGLSDGHQQRPVRMFFCPLGS
jgi:hypothetical protein